MQQAVPALGDDATVVVLSGDVPLTQSDTLFHLIQASGRHLALLTLEIGNPTGYGRIVRVDDLWRRGARWCCALHHRHKDANEAQRAITEIYSGIMAVPAAALKRWLARLDNKNAQNEYYLTDIVKFAVAEGVGVVAHKIWTWCQQPGATGGIGAGLSIARSPPSDENKRCTPGGSSAY